MINQEKGFLYVYIKITSDNWLHFSQQRHKTKWGTISCFTITIALRECARAYKTTYMLQLTSTCNLFGVQNLCIEGGFVHISSAGIDMWGVIRPQKRDVSIFQTMRYRTNATKHIVSNTCAFFYRNALHIKYDASPYEHFLLLPYALKITYI